MRKLALRRRLGAIALTALLSLALAPGFARPASAAGQSPSLFHTVETFSPDTSLFTKWTDAVARTKAQEDHPELVCPQGGSARNCIVYQWRYFVATLRRLPVRERVERVNQMFNRLPYVPSTVNWHDPNHWETPFEFLTRGGQCEDYAIAKFMALAESGVPQSDLRVFVVHDKTQNLDHAITVVWVDGEALVLDNQSPDVRPAGSVDGYLPYYSINLEGWWQHQSAPAAEPVRVASAAASQAVQ